MAGWRCSPSGMSVYQGASGLCVEGRDVRPARPGMRDANGGMAFSVWVRHVAPASRPARPSA